MQNTEYWTMLQASFSITVQYPINLMIIWMIFCVFCSGSFCLHINQHPSCKSLLIRLKTVHTIFCIIWDDVLCLDGYDVYYRRFYCTVEGLVEDTPRGTRIKRKLLKTLFCHFNCITRLHACIFSFFYSGKKSRPNCNWWLSIHHFISLLTGMSCGVCSLK